MQTLEFRAMNTKVILAADGFYLDGYGIQAARAFIEESERRFSRFLPDSEVSQLNRSAGAWHNISNDLMDMLEQSMNFYKETGGLFDPSILPDLKRIGYDKSMDEIQANGITSSSASSRTLRPDFGQMEIDLPRQRARLPKGMEIDLGGIAKGWIVEKAAALLNCYSTACAVSAGGDIVFKGYPRDNSFWRVNIEDPRDPTQAVSALQVGPGAVVTSSIAKRAWMQSGKARHHLIDPRTGEPAETNWLSVTVISPFITAAEVYAKALLIGGEGDAARLAAQRPELAYIVVKSDGNIFCSENSEEFFNDYSFIQ
jgi:thiamine biosynthesis lipoprotein